MITPNDVVKVVEAADDLGEHLSNAEGAGVLIMHSIDPEVYAKLNALIDNGTV